MIVVKVDSHWHPSEKCAWNRHFGILYFSRVVSQKKIVIALFYLSPSLFFFWLRCTAWEILVTQPGIRPCPLQWKCRVFNHWTTREFPYISFLTKNILLCDDLYSKPVWLLHWFKNSNMLSWKIHQGYLVKCAKRSAEISQKWIVKKIL